MMKLHLLLLLCLLSLSLCSSSAVEENKRQEYFLRNKEGRLVAGRRLEKHEHGRQFQAQSVPAGYTQFYLTWTADDKSGTNEEG